MRIKSILVFLCLVISYAYARPTLLIIDASGSMADSMDNGQTKIDAAKSVAKDIVSNANDKIALMVYTDCDEGGDPYTGNIRVYENFTNDKQTLDSEIDQITPDSSTPIANSIKEASTYIYSTGGNAGIVLLTDGEETCDTFDPNELATFASSHGVNVINVVGFQLSDSAKQQMLSLATAAQGQYYDANDTASLQSDMAQAYNSASGGSGSSGSSCCAPAVILLALAGAVIKGKN